MYHRHLFREERDAIIHEAPRYNVARPKEAVY